MFIWSFIIKVLLKFNILIRVAELLESELSKVLNILGSSGLRINLNGLGSFHNDVLFANISCGEDLDKLIVLSGEYEYLKESY